MATQELHKAWWKESVIYQIYPRSFNDSDGDGIGDLRGIIEKLDYLKDLGVDIIWLSPVYESPNDDNGYDISDYYAIMKEFGSMADFDELLAGMKQRGLKLLMDLVVNHSSDEHAWFQEARKSKDNPYRDFYIWKPGTPNTPPNNWVSFFSGSAWEWDDTTQEYYLHYFTKKQPDLNWENETMRFEIYKMMRFWLDKGVDGFRMDVIPLISKDQHFPPFPEDFDGNFPAVYASGPRIHEFLQEMHCEVLSKYDIMTVGEGIGVAVEEANDYVGHSRNELNMIFHFDHMGIDRSPEDFWEFKQWKVSEFKAVFNRWDAALGNEGWNSIYLGNHDFPRLLSRFGNDSIYWKQSGKLFATLLLSLRGTPYIYQGDEFGMTNVAYDSIEDYNDVQTHNAYRELKAQGGDLDKFLKAQHRFSRDNARTPIQWSAETNAGFTNGTPWLKINPNYVQVNAAAALADPDSILHHYKKMIQLRKQHEVLVYGAYQDLDPTHEQVYAYTRTLGTQRLLILLNISENAATYTMPGTLVFTEKILLIGNYSTPQDTGNQTFMLAPYEARIYQLK